MNAKILIELLNTVKENKEELEWLLQKQDQLRIEYLNFFKKDFQEIKSNLNYLDNNEDLIKEITKIFTENINISMKIVDSKNYSSVKGEIISNLIDQLKFDINEFENAVLQKEFIYKGTEDLFSEINQEVTKLINLIGNLKIQISKKSFDLFSENTNKFSESISFIRGIIVNLSTNKDAILKHPDVEKVLKKYPKEIGNLTKDIDYLINNFLKDFNSKFYNSSGLFENRNLKVKNEIEELDKNYENKKQVILENLDKYNQILKNLRNMIRDFSQ